MVIRKDIKAIIFDFDGTLFLLEVDWEQLNRDLQRTFGIDSLLHLTELSSEQYHSALRLVREAELAGVAKGRPAKGAREVLETLAQTYQLAFISRNTREAVLEGLKEIGYHTSAIITAKQDMKQPKPHPDSLETTLHTLGVSTDEAVMVGDTYHDVDMAKTAHVKSVVVKNAKLTFQPLGADYYINSLRELPALLNEIIMGKT